MFLVIVAAVLVLVLGAMLLADRRRRGRVDTSRVDDSRARLIGEKYDRPNIPQPPTSF